MKKKLRMIFLAYPNFLRFRHPKSGLNSPEQLISSRQPHTPPPFMLTLPVMTSKFEPCLQWREKWSETPRFKFRQTFADGPTPSPAPL
jgi:hypothetical protein